MSQVELTEGLGLEVAVDLDVRNLRSTKRRLGQLADAEVAHRSPPRPVR